MSKGNTNRERKAPFKSSSASKIITAVLIVAAFAAVIYLGLRKKEHLEEVTHEPATVNEV